MLSAFIHYAGIIFYGIFASGELQPWADPKVEEERQWNQLNEAVPVTKYSVSCFWLFYGWLLVLVLFKAQPNGLMQRQLSGGVTNYGAAMETALPPMTPSEVGPKFSVDILINRFFLG